jgi:hypothetical protein
MLYVACSRALLTDVLQISFYTKIDNGNVVFASI